MRLNLSPLAQRALTQLGQAYCTSLVGEAQARGESAQTLTRLERDQANMQRILARVAHFDTLSDFDIHWLTRTLSHAFGAHHLFSRDEFTAQPIEDLFSCHDNAAFLNLMRRWDSLALNSVVHQVTGQMRGEFHESDWTYTAQNIVHDTFERLSTARGLFDTGLSLVTGIGAGMIVGTFLPATGVFVFVGRSVITSCVQTSLTNGVEDFQRWMSGRSALTGAEWVSAFKRNVFENFLGDFVGLGSLGHNITEQVLNVVGSTGAADVANVFGMMREEYENVGSYWERLAEGGLNHVLMRGARQGAEGAVRLARFVGEVNPVNVALGVGAGVAVGVLVSHGGVVGITGGIGALFGDLRGLGSAGGASETPPRLSRHILSAMKSVAVMSRKQESVSVFNGDFGSTISPPQRALPWELSQHSIGKVARVMLLRILLNTRGEIGVVPEMHHQAAFDDPVAGVHPQERTSSIFNSSELIKAVLAEIRKARQENARVIGTHDLQQLNDEYRELHTDIEACRKFDSQARHDHKIHADRYISRTRDKKREPFCLKITQEHQDLIERAVVLSRRLFLVEEAIMLIHEEAVWSYLQKLQRDGRLAGRENVRVIDVDES